MKYKWKVDSKPTGRYSSFERRGFPTAEYENGKTAARIYSDGEDWEYDSKIKEYKSLVLSFENYSTSPSSRRKLIKRFNTIQEAKDAFEKFLKTHPEIQPGNLRQGLPINITG